MRNYKLGTWVIERDLFGDTPRFILTCPHCRKSWPFVPTGLVDRPDRYFVIRRCPHCKGNVTYAPPPAA